MIPAKLKGRMHKPQISVQIINVDSRRTVTIKFKGHSMAFKENLLKKIQIDRLTDKVKRSLIPKGTIKIDKDAIKELLGMVPYKHKNDRFMDLFVKKSDDPQPEILVLDNELPLYKTTIEDVLLRKNPTLKEMISIKNAIKILNDSDVVISKKEDTVEILKKECLALLDLNYNAADIETIKKDGIAHLENWETDQVIDCFYMFTELLGYQIIPPFLKIEKIMFSGLKNYIEEKETFGPILIYDVTHNVIKFLNEKINAQNKEKTNHVKNVAVGKEKCELEGTDVFEHLAELVVKTMRPLTT